MKLTKLFTILFAASMASASFAQVVTPVWELNQAQGAMPAWFSTDHLERGVAYGEVDSAGGVMKEVVIAVSRNGGNVMVVMDAATGDSIMTLDPTGISGGTYNLNDVEISDDGVIFIGNLTINTNSSAFKVYRYDNLTDTPTEVINQTTTGAYRCGDKFTVTGSASDSSLTIWAAASTNTAILKFTTADNGATFTMEEITTDAAFGSSAQVHPLSDTSMMACGIGTGVDEYGNSGGHVGAVLGSVYPSSVAALKVFEIEGKGILLGGRFGGSDQFVTIGNATDGYSSVFHIANTPTMGANANTNAVGDLDYKVIGDGLFDVFVLGTNNGVACYRVDLNQVDFAGGYNVGDGGNFMNLYAAFQGLSQYGVSDHVDLTVISDLEEIAGPPTITAAAGLDTMHQLMVGTDGGHSVNLRSGAITVEEASYVTIDGDAGDDADLRDLSIYTYNGSDGIAITPTGDHVTIKNLMIMNGDASGDYGVFADLYADGCEEILVDNCQIGEEFVPFKQSGVAVWGSTGDAYYVTNPTVSNCDIWAGRRAITTWACANPVFINNNINVVNPTADQFFYAGIYFAGNAGGCTATGNHIIMGPSNGSGGEVYGVNINGNTGPVVIANNMIDIALEDVQATPTNDQWATGIGFTFAVVTDTLCLITHNTVRMAPASAGLEGAYIAAIGDDGDQPTENNKIINNILVNDNDGANSYAIELAAQTAGFEMTANDLYVSAPTAQVGKYDGTDHATVASWMTASGSMYDVSHAITFVDAANGDLHLDNTTHAADVVLAGVPTVLATDIDGDARLLTAPYMGADELSTPVPVLLTSFAAQSDDEGVVLTWETAEETDVAYFEAQRQDGDDFVGVGRIDAKGSGSSYRFVDAAAKAGVLKYRLKVVDRDGSFSFADVIEVAYDKVAEYALDQNYPNPFNPTTTINYSLAEQTHVKLVVFNMLGEEVATLVNSNQQAGSYKVQFNASNLASGMYVYRLETPAFTKTLKMSLVK